MRPSLVAVAVFAAAVLSPVPRLLAAPEPAPYTDPPFTCEVIDYGTEAPPATPPPEDPLCVKYDKTNITLSTLEAIDFLAAEPTRITLVAGKCSYWQQDHWVVRATPESTPILEWEGSYWYDGRTGTAAGIFRGFRVAGHPADGMAFADTIEPIVGPEVADHIRAYSAEGGGGGASFALPRGFGEDACGGTAVVVDAGRTQGAVNRELVGVGWHPGGPPLAVVDDLDPAMVRVDASLQDVSPAPGELRLGSLLAHVAEIRAVGSEPLVILSYMPAWLGAPNAHGRDPTRVAPSDLGAWQTLVHDVVHALATAPSPALRFEAWNEPDIPLFWQDTPAAWSSMVERTARAIASVEAETGVDLAFGGPATAFPDPVYLAAFLTPLRDRSLPLDFVSWHYYGNTPFLGPDGNEFGVLEPIQPVAGQRNPLTSPAAYGMQVPLMRQWTEALLAGSGRPQPMLIIDEWNLSPGGFDHRHDRHAGAAFAAATLIEMQHAGLDQSAFFKAVDSPPPDAASSYGGHGLVRYDGSKKPVWWSLWFWQQLAGTRVKTSGTDHTSGLWATASSDTGRVTVLVASFSASRPTDRTIDLSIRDGSGTPVGASIRRIDGGNADPSAPTPLTIEGGRIRFDLPAQSVAFVDVDLRGS